MEAPKAWKPRKAWHLDVKETGTQDPTPGKNGNEPSSQVGGWQGSQWSGPGPGPQRMECTRKHLGRGLEEAAG